MKDTPETTLVLKRTLKAPVDVVYAAWTEPAQFGQWMGPNDEMSCAVDAHDVRVGGAYAFKLTNAEGKVHGASGRFREVVENERTYCAGREELDRLNFVDIDFLDHHQRYAEMQYTGVGLDAGEADMSELLATSGHWLCVGRGCQFDCSYCGGGRA